MILGPAPIQGPAVMHVQMSVMLCEKIPPLCEAGHTTKSFTKCSDVLGFIQAAPPCATSQSAAFADQAAAGTTCCRLTIETPGSPQAASGRNGAPRRADQWPPNLQSTTASWKPTVDSAKHSCAPRLWIHRTFR